MKKPVGRKVPCRRTLSGQLGRIVRPHYTTDNLCAPGQPPESIRLDTTLFDAIAERRRSPSPAGGWQAREPSQRLDERQRVGDSVRNGAVRPS